jgi:hypothetical protein
MAKQTEKGRVVKEALANFPKTSKKTGSVSLRHLLNKP